MSRPSHVRNAIERLITTSTRHDWSADSVLHALSALAVAADYSSVCRGLARLEQTGVIRRVNLGDGKTRYEADHEHHEHVRCDRCGAVAAVPGCTMPAGRERAEAETGYLITGHHVLFSGLCAGCSKVGDN
jgi:Fur family ferric uptake transcriptional regulator